MDIAIEQLFLYLGVTGISAFSATLTVKYLLEVIKETDQTGHLNVTDEKLLMLGICALVTLVTGGSVIRTWFD